MTRLKLFLVLVGIIAIYFISEIATHTSTEPRPTPTPFVSLDSFPISPTPVAVSSPSPRPSSKPVPPKQHELIDTFEETFTLQESPTMNSSKSKNWWLSSGGIFYSGSGTARTVMGDLPIGSTWHSIYNQTNPMDSDNGAHPQNIFRLVTNLSLVNTEQRLYFKILKDNLSLSTNRNSSNGVLLLNRYHNSENLYYTGLRVDGAAVIKKKVDSAYYTLAYAKVIEGAEYNHETYPNLLPKNEWIGIKSQVTNLKNGHVSIKLFLDVNNSGAWKLVLEGIDDGTFGGEPITSGGHGGIRTDFLDVEFSRYYMKAL